MKYLITIHYPHSKQNYSTAFVSATDALEWYQLQATRIEELSEWNKRHNAQDRTLSLSEAHLLEYINVTQFKPLTVAELKARSVKESKEIALGA